MKEGLLWYDDNPGRDLAEKIKRAAHRYRQKFGSAPDICYVHPTTLRSQGKDDSAQSRTVNGVRVAPLTSVLQHHFWVGREEKRQGGKRKGIAKPITKGSAAA